MANPNNLPVHAQKPRTIGGVVTEAITGITTDVPGKLVLLGAAGPNGSVLTRAWANPRSSSSASSLLLFIKRPGIARYQLADSTAVGTFAGGTTLQKPYHEFTRYTLKNPLDLGPGDEVYAGCEIAQPNGLDVNATLRDF